MKVVNAHKERSIIFQFVLVGEAFTAKITLIDRYVNKTFTNNIATIGFEIRGKSLEINNNDINISIIDTAGQGIFSSITKRYYEGADGFLILFNLTRKDTFEQINYWINQIEMNRNKEYPLSCVLVGTFCDDKENIEVKEEDIKIIIEKYNIKYFKASAKDGTNVDAVFEYLTKITLKSRGLLTKIGLDDNTPLDEIKIIEKENQKIEIPKRIKKKKKGIFDKLGISFKDNKNNEKEKNKIENDAKNGIKKTEKENDNKIEFRQLKKYIDF